MPIKFLDHLKSSIKGAAKAAIQLSEEAEKSNRSLDNSKKNNSNKNKNVKKTKTTQLQSEKGFFDKLNDSTKETFKQILGDIIINNPTLRDDYPNNNINSENLKNTYQELIMKIPVSKKEPEKITPINYDRYSNFHRLTGDVKSYIDNYNKESEKKGEILRKGKRAFKKGVPVNKVPLRADERQGANDKYGKHFNMSDLIYTGNPEYDKDIYKTITDIDGYPSTIRRHFNKDGTYSFFRERDSHINGKKVSASRDITQDYEYSDSDKQKIQDKKETVESINEDFFNTVLSNPLLLSKPNYMQMFNEIGELQPDLLKKVVEDRKGVKGFFNGFLDSVTKPFRVGNNYTNAARDFTTRINQYDYFTPEFSAKYKTMNDIDDWEGFKNVAGRILFDDGVEDKRTIGNEFSALDLSLNKQGRPNNPQDYKRGQQIFAGGYKNLNSALWGEKNMQQAQDALRQRYTLTQMHEGLPDPFLMYDINQDHKSASAERNGQMTLTHADQNMRDLYTAHTWENLYNKDDEKYPFDANGNIATGEGNYDPYSAFHRYSLGTKNQNAPKDERENYYIDKWNYLAEDSYLQPLLHSNLIPVVSDNVTKKKYEEAKKRKQQNNRGKKIKANSQGREIVWEKEYKEDTRELPWRYKYRR